MNINWILRLQNKATLSTLCVIIISAVYSVLATLGITPSITQEQSHNLFIAAIDVAAAIGIVVDPTTKGIGDSDRAMGYIKPYEE